MTIRSALSATAFAFVVAGAGACTPKQAPPAPSAPAAPTNTNSSAPVTPPTSEAPSHTETARGQELFSATCASCHLASGKGEPHHKKDDIPDFTSESWQAHQDDDEIAAAIRNGKGKVMPAFGSRLSSDDIKALVGYIRGFPDRPAPAASEGESHEHGDHSHH